MITRLFLFTALTLSALCSWARETASNDTLGIFAVYADSMQRMEKINHSKVKTSGALGSMMTMGLTKTKAKLEFRGKTSPYHFDNAAHFRIYFGTTNISQAAQYYMFSGSYSIRDFGIAKFEVKKNKRLMQGMTTSLINTDIGVELSEDVKIKTNELRPGVYDMTVNGAPGEYCIVFTGSGYPGFTGVFDFTIE